VRSGSGEFTNTSRFDISNTVLADIGVCRFRVLSEKGGPGMIRQSFELSGRRMKNNLIMSSPSGPRQRQLTSFRAWRNSILSASVSAPSILLTSSGKKASGAPTAMLPVHQRHSIGGEKAYQQQRQRRFGLPRFRS